MASLPSQLPQLAQIVWHDTPVSAMHVDIVGQCFSLVLTPYEEKRDNYGRVEVSFSQISNLEMQLSALAAKRAGDDLEVYSLEVTAANESYSAHLVLLTDHGPSSAIAFDFQGVTVS